MKQIWPNYSYSPATNVLTLTGLNIDRDQLLLVTAADRGRIMYNFADSSVTASAFTSGANTALTLVATTAGLTTTAALVIYYDDQVSGISGTVTASISGAQLYDQGLLDGGDNFKIAGVVSLGIQQSDDVDANINFLPIGFAQSDGGGMLDYWVGVKQTNPLPVYLPSTYPLPAGTNRIGVVTIGGGTVTIGAGTSQIGSVTASISGTVPISISSVTVGNSVTIGSCVTHGVTIANTSVTVNGTFYQATQPVSLSTVPTHGVTLTSTTVTISSMPAISGTVTANLSKPTWTNYSGTVVTANTAVTAITNTSRSYLLAQVTTGQMFLNIGATATSLNSVYFSAGQGFAWETSVPQGIVSVISAVTGTNYVLKEG